ncbi:MAG: ribonuclease H-like domain-containing protein, partial [Treponema sp.]|nr:ribonuclease H-like domain-containing protein [Treponema sp.]
MAGDLRSRLKRIREIGLAPASELKPPEHSAAPAESHETNDAKKKAPAEKSAAERFAKGRAAKKNIPVQGPPSVRRGKAACAPGNFRAPKDFSDWEAAGYFVLHRALVKPLRRPLARELPAALPLLAPDLGNSGRPFSPDGKDRLGPGDFLFFDLETTGLSGGAGTVAFLAAFGTFIAGGDLLKIDQFLLLDYPGEADFIDAVLRFIASCGDVYLTTYNGKSFDSQILKTRCLMNGFRPLQLPQLDLLHPARRLWKRILSGCSQAVIELEVLGLDRGEDISGAFAPDIWFRYLRSHPASSPPEGSAGAADSPYDGFGAEETALNLVKICDHNVRDIAGLAALFQAFTEIAADPLKGSGRYNCDTEHLAMVWRREYGAASAEKYLPFDELEKMSETAEALLESAAADWPRAGLRLAFDRFR